MGIINSLDMKVESSGPTSDEIQLKTVTKAALAKIILMEDISWRQKVKSSLASSKGS